MTKFLPIVYIRWTVVVEVLSCAFDTIVKALALNLAELSGRGVPSAIAIVILDEIRRAWRRLRRRCSSDDESACSQLKGKP